MTHFSFRSARLLVPLFLMLMAVASVMAQAPIPHTLSGTIREAESNEAAIGVSVFLTRDTSVQAQSRAIVRGTRTNKVGFFSLPDVPEGSYFLVVRGVGYVTLVCPVRLPESASFSLVLSRQTARLGQVTVRATGDLRETVQSISRVDVSAETIARLPSFGGQKDVFRALLLLPGVQSAGELSSGLYVRGGSTDQNLTLLDGALIYNPSHLVGFFSTFTADAIQDIRLHKGAFPAEYGGRLSSVIDLTMKEGNTKRVKGNATFSTIILEANLEGPIVSSNATFMLSGRRMILDWLIEAQKALTDNIPADAPLPLYYFYDLNAKLSYKLSDNDRLFLSGYTGRDQLGFDASGLTLGLGWGNLSGNLRWAHVVSPSLFTNFSLIYTKYDYTTSLSARLGQTRQVFSTLSQIEDWTARGEAQWTLSANHSMKAGLEAIRHHFRNTVGTRLDPAPMGLSGISETDGSVSGLEAALYAQDEWQVDERLLLNTGLRTSWFQAGGQVNVEPRLSAGYALSDEVRLTASFSLVNQYVHLLSRNDISLPSDTWLPATDNILPSRALQYTLGAETQLLGGEANLTVEGYYKTMQNLYEYRDGTILNSLNTNRLSEQLTRGSGESYGVEVLLERKTGALTGWLGYTLSWANRTFPELNGGKPFAPRYDRRHNLSLALTYVLDDQWEFGATWTYISGQPITLPAGQADIADINANTLQQGSIGTAPSPTYYFTERNGSRMTPFHKLDLSATMRTAIFIFPGEYYVSIYNAYNNMNPFAWFITTETNPASPRTVKPVVQQLTIFPILPTIGMRIKF